MKTLNWFGLGVDFYLPRPLGGLELELLAPGKFLVVEGNRRVAALKYLERRHSEVGLDLGKLDAALFSSVPVVVYPEADAAHHLLIMGLAHISGKKKWPLVNQALLQQKLIEEQNWSEQDVCEALQISKRELRSTLKTLRLCDKYKKSDYGDQFVAANYNIFREVVRSREMSSWLYGDQQIPDSIKADRLFSWISRVEGEADEESEIDSADMQASVITTGKDVRELAKIINDEKNALPTIQN